ncbi:RNA-directed DNA polymerase, eukaryota, reverse transcriptase zinc-binding domain protein [Tanacetum coccineum]
MYKSKNIREGTKKIVNVEYSWIPSICSQCKVFGHNENFCKKGNKEGYGTSSVDKNENEYKTVQNRKFGRNGFNMNRNFERQNGYNAGKWIERRNVKGGNKWQANNEVEYRRRQANVVDHKDSTENSGVNEKNNEIKDNKEEFYISERKEWTAEMKRYYRDRKEMCNAVRDLEENKDVLEESDDGITSVMRNGVEESGGLCSQSDKQKEVKKLIMEEKLQLCAVLETHVKYKNIKKVCDHVFRSWEYMTNGEDNNKGCRIMVGWNSNVIQAWLIAKSREFMFFMMETIDRKSRFFCTMIYASNSRMERRNLWKDLERQKIITTGNPWIIMGDFNDCINKVELVDLHSAGFQFTWTKSLRNPKCKTLKKLDRIMVNAEFVDKFQQAHGLFLPYLISDHSPIIVKIPDGVQKRKSSFRFSNFITEKKLGEWQCVERAENLRSKVKECEVDKFPHNDSIKEKSWSTLREYQEATKEEYSLLCQKAKVEWLREGDRNTVYFHKTIKEIVHRSIIMTIRNEDGTRFVNEDVAIQFVKHFENFLGQRRDVQSLASRQDIFKNKINTEDAQRMVRNISDSEIKNAMSKIEDSKAPGPDGYTARFYKSAWSIVGSEVCQAIKYFFTNGKILGEVNATLITLVPKIPTPGKVSDFRPIACCNVLYKCISKILTTRIKGVLGKLVGENQSAFIEGRQITDNILLSQELFRGYNRKHNIKKVSFKIDLQKAYDTISWDFLKEIIVMFGFHEKMFLTFLFKRIYKMAMASSIILDARI